MGPESCQWSPGFGCLIDPFNMVGHKITNSAQEESIFRRIMGKKAQIKKILK